MKTLLNQAAMLSCSLKVVTLKWLLYIAIHLNIKGFLKTQLTHFSFLQV